MLPPRRNEQKMKLITASNMQNSPLHASSFRHLANSDMFPIGPLGTNLIQDIAFKNTVCKMANFLSVLACWRRWWWWPLWVQACGLAATMICVKVVFVPTSRNWHWVSLELQSPCRKWPQMCNVGLYPLLLRYFPRYHLPFITEWSGQQKFLNHQYVTMTL